MSEPPAELVTFLLMEGAGAGEAQRAAVREHGGRVFRDEAGAPQLVDLAPPEPLYQVSGPDLPGDFPPLRTLERLPGNLSAFATTFVGRARETAEIQALLAASDGPRLVTLTGAGGMGKSRPALQAAAGLYGAFPDGVYAVSLAAVRQPGLVLPAMAQALHLKEVAGQPLAETLAAYLRQKRVLLVLDDFDLTLGAGGLVAGLLAAALGGSRVLVTSRARLDGLPLALELAAARCRQPAPAEILAQLASPLTLAAGPGSTLPPRQQTLRGTIGWSYNLLSPPEQRLLAQCAVFAGGFTREAARAVALDAPLAALVDKSLLRYDQGRERYALLEVIREYAHERLVASGERGALCARHARYFAELAETAEPELTGARQVDWLNRLETEHANLRAALAWAIETGAGEIAARLGAALWRFWSMHGHLSEGYAQLLQVLAQPGIGESRTG
jgi:predicted ATPase